LGDGRGVVFLLERVFLRAPGELVQDPKSLKTPTAPKTLNQHERERFLAALKRLAFSPEFGVDYAETATILLQVVATIVGCEGWDDARWAEVFRQECARARLFDHAEQIREASGPGEA
jgi:hypothetical protein